MTTNFDLLLEKAYEAVARPCLPMLEEFQLSGHNPYLGPTLLKFHGDVHHPQRMVMTEDDYDGFLAQHPLLATHLAALLIDHTGILIGYSLDDPDTRQVLALLRERLGRMTRPLWVLQVDAPAHVVSRYERRGVRVLNLPRADGATYGSVLAELFEELRAHWQRELMQESQSTEERTLVELHLPSESSSTCYFAVPLDLIQWYREVFFPLVEEVGLVPVLSRDVVTPAGTISAKIDALIERAKLVVVDLSSPRSFYEAGFAMGAKDADAVLFIAADSDSMPADMRGRRYIIRPKDLTAPSEDVMSAFRAWLASHTPTKGRRNALPDAERLLDVAEPGYALIASVAELERRLANLMHDEGSNVALSIMRLLRGALQREALTVEEFNELRLVVQKRNEALHLAKAISMDEARRAIALVTSIVERWPRDPGAR